MCLISINILNYNTFEKSKLCIDSCLRQIGIEIRIILIDNSSTDDSFIRLKEIYGDRIDYLQNGENYGFAKGNNLGVEYAIKRGYRHSLLLNSDTELIGKTLVCDLVRMFKENNESAIIVPDVYDVTSIGLIKHTNDSPYLKLLRIGRILPKNRRLKKNLTTISEAHGCALMVDNRRFNEVGGFPEHYFMYGEESLFSKKIIWSGYSILWFHSGDSRILHHHDKTGAVDPWRLYLMGRNRGLEYYEYRERFFLWRIIYWIFYTKMLIFNNASHRYYLKGMNLSSDIKDKNLSDDTIFRMGKEIKNKYTGL